MKSTNNCTPFTLESTAQIFIRCFWIGMGVVSVWFGLFVLAGPWSYEIHRHLWHGLTQHEFALINLCGMAIMKLGVFSGFLLPYLGIRMVINKQENRNKTPRTAA